MNLFVKQYDWIRLTREKMFQYCELMNTEDYTYELDQFGWGSIRNVHVHVAECYQSWLPNFGLNKGTTPVTAKQVSNVQDMRQVFEEIDRLVYEFLDTFNGQWEFGIRGSVPWQEEKEELTPLWLYTHVITHEFHHKGQIVSMGRNLSYIPEDTDLIEPAKID